MSFGGQILNTLADSFSSAFLCLEYMLYDSSKVTHIAFLNMLCNTHCTCVRIICLFNPNVIVDVEDIDKTTPYHIKYAEVYQ